MAATWGGGGPETRGRFSPEPTVSALPWWKWWLLRRQTDRLRDVTRLVFDKSNSVLTSIARAGEFVVLVIIAVLIVGEAEVGARTFQVPVHQHGGCLRGLHGHPRLRLPHLLAKRRG